MNKTAGLMLLLGLLIIVLGFTGRVGYFIAILLAPNSVTAV